MIEQDAYKVGENLYLKIAGKLYAEDFPTSSSFSVRVYDKTTGTKIYDQIIDGISIPSSGESDVNAEFSLPSFNAEDLKDLVAELYSTEGGTETIYGGITLKSFKPFIKLYNSKGEEFSEADMPTGKYREGEQISLDAKVFNADIDSISNYLALEDDSGNEVSAGEEQSFLPDQASDVAVRTTALTIPDIAKIVKGNGKYKVCLKTRGKSAQRAKSCRSIGTGLDLDVYTKIFRIRGPPVVDIVSVDEDNANLKAILGEGNWMSIAITTDGSFLYALESGDLQNTLYKVNLVTNEKITVPYTIKNGKPQFLEYCADNNLYMINNMNEIYVLGNSEPLHSIPVSDGAVDFTCSATNQNELLLGLRGTSKNGVYSLNLITKELKKIIDVQDITSDDGRLSNKVESFENYIIFGDNKSRIFKLNINDNSTKTYNVDNDFIADILPNGEILVKIQNSDLSRDLYNVDSQKLVAQNITNSFNEILR